MQNQPWFGSMKLASASPGSDENGIEMALSQE